METKHILGIINVLFLIVTTVIFSGCKGEDNLNSDETIRSNIPYAIREKMSIGIRPEAISNKYGDADISRKIGEMYYEIRMLEDGSKLISVFSTEANKLVEHWRLDKFLNKDVFNDLVLGESTQKDVIDIDPYTTIIELTENKAISEHKLVNNESAIITYKIEKEYFNVENIEYLAKDPSELYQLLTDEDKELFNID